MACREWIQQCRCAWDLFAFGTQDCLDNNIAICKNTPAYYRYVCALAYMCARLLGIGEGVIEKAEEREDHTMSFSESVIETVSASCLSM